MTATGQLDYTGSVVSPEFILTVKQNIGTVAGFTLQFDDKTIGIVIDGMKHTGTISGLVAGTDYTLAVARKDGTGGTAVSIENNGIITIATTITEGDAGTYTVTATGSGNYGGSKEDDFELIYNLVMSEWMANKRYKAITQNTTGTAIRTRAELEAITVGGEYHLAADIDLTGSEWTALHSEAAPFTGKLYGNGFILYGLKIDKPNENYQGLFASTKNATIENLGIVIDSITANAIVGGLAGYVQDDLRGSYLNIAVAGVDASSTITADGSTPLGSSQTAKTYVGGLVGVLEPSGILEGMNYGLTVQATDANTNYSNAGGLVGVNYGVVTGIVTGSVSGVSEMVGGLVGHTSSGGKVMGIFTGSVSGSGYVGGLAGSAAPQSPDGVRGIVTGSIISSGSVVGGLTGSLYRGSLTGIFTGTVSNSTGNKVGGLVGKNGGSGIAATLIGYSLGWVLTASANTNDIGTVTGVNEALGTTTAYYNSVGGDHLGNSDNGTRDTNGLGTAIDGVANATAANMPSLTEGTAEGQWTFTAGQWPKLNLPDWLEDPVDYSAEPAKPDPFFD